MRKIMWVLFLPERLYGVIYKWRQIGMRMLFWYQEDDEIRTQIRQENLNFWNLGSSFNCLRICRNPILEFKFEREKFRSLLKLRMYEKKNPDPKVVHPLKFLFYIPVPDFPQIFYIISELSQKPTKSQERRKLFKDIFFSSIYWMFYVRLFNI